MEARNITDSKEQIKEEKEETLCGAFTLVCKLLCIRKIKTGKEKS